MLPNYLYASFFTIKSSKMVSSRKCLTETFSKKLSKTPPFKLLVSQNLDRYEISCTNSDHQTYNFLAILS